MSEQTPPVSFTQFFEGRNWIDALFQNLGKVLSNLFAAGLILMAALTLLAMSIENQFGAESVLPFLGLLCCAPFLLGGLALPLGWRFLRRGKKRPPQEPAPTPVETPEPAPADAPTNQQPTWEFITSQQSHRTRNLMLPLGWTANGLFSLNFATDPHVVIAGKTGMGKTESLVRPLPVFAALRGWQVVILDKSGRDFQALAGHPNIHLVRYQASTLLPILDLLWQEVGWRDQWLARYGVRKYELVRADVRPPRTMIVIDELSNALLDAPKADRQQAEESLVKLGNQARALAVHLVIVAQRPTADQLTPSLVSNMTPICFGVNDANEARYARCPGAEQLDLGQAIVSTRGYPLITCWHPDDADLKAALQRYDGPIHKPPTWLKTLPQLPHYPTGFGVPLEKTIPIGAVQEVGHVGLNGHTDQVLAKLLQETTPVNVNGESMTLGQFRAVQLLYLLGQSENATMQQIWKSRNATYRAKVQTARAAVDGLTMENN